MKTLWKLILFIIYLGKLEVGSARYFWTQTQTAIAPCILFWWCHGVKTNPNTTDLLTLVILILNSLGTCRTNESANIPNLSSVFSQHSFLSHFFLWTKPQQLSGWSFLSEVFSINKSVFFPKIHLPSWRNHKAYFWKDVCFHSGR